jgi:hypothetical protein
MKSSLQGLWVTRGALAAARLQARTGQRDVIELDITEENRHRDPSAWAANGFVTEWRSVFDRLQPGHARRVLLNQLVSEASATYVRKGERKQLQSLWSAVPIAAAEHCWVGYAGGFEVTWQNDPVYPAVTFLTLVADNGA